MILYPDGGQGAADQLAAALPGAGTDPSAAVAAGTVRIVLGSGFTLTQAPASPDATAVPRADSLGAGPAASAVPITAAGAAPPPNTMSALSGAGVPCVK